MRWWNGSGWTEDVRPKGAAAPQAGAGMQAPQQVVPPAGGAYPSPPGWASAPRTDGMAIASMVLGIVTVPLVFFLIGFITGILAIVLGAVSRGRIGRSNGQLTGKGMALAGILVGAIAMVLYVVLLVIVFSDPEIRAEIERQQGL